MRGGLFIWREAAGVRSISKRQPANGQRATLKKPRGRDDAGPPQGLGFVTQKVHAPALPDLGDARINRRAAGSVLLAGFATALFLSAFLLFSVQPVVSRMLLPRLGGSPSVWNTCVCFFQAALLVGYSYAHFVASRLRPRTQLVWHGLALASGFTVLPLSLGVDAPSPDAGPIFWLLIRLAVAVGPPFVAIAATAPLLQHWFSLTNHPRARDPYFLYVASNCGSLLALLSYPVLIETTLGLSDQARLWSIGFAATAAIVLACGAVARFDSASAAAPVVGPEALVTNSERLHWVALAFLPSALMLAVTTYITTDIAATPLFWVAPLAIYIGTYIMAFARRQIVGRATLLTLQAIALAGAALTSVMGAQNFASLLIALGAFTFTAAVCHTELARRRPDVRHLTGYYLLISVGGALGGMFSALLAPILFPGPWEYPLLLVAACLLRPPLQPLRWSEVRAIRIQWLLIVALIALAIAFLWAAASDGLGAFPSVTRIALYVATGIPLLWVARRRWLSAIAMAGLLSAPALIDAPGTLMMTRTFFGVLRVQAQPNDDLVVLKHGTTIHGFQSTRPGEELLPLGYYGRSSPFGRLFAVLGKRTPPIKSVSVLGLGTGGLGCYARPGEQWTFREIDPEVERIARNNRWFHFMDGCGNHPTVVLGDARLTLAADTAARYDLIIADAFSSDSVPVHLLTREALQQYFARLKPGGIVLFHVSNRYLDLTPVIARLAKDAGAPVRHLLVLPLGSERRQTGAEVVAVGAPRK